MILGPTSPPRLPIGHSDYANLRRDGLTYVDKSLWVADVLDTSSSVLLVPRPRRFGKTLNMSTLRYFLERSDDDRTDLFEDTALWRAEDGRYLEHFQRYPVIYLTFKDVKDPSWEICQRSLARLLTRSLRHLHLLGHLDLKDSGDMRRTEELCNADSPIDAFRDMLADVSEWCHRATGQRVVILIDEYDTPLHSAWEHGYWDEACAFFRSFLPSGLKDNPHLYKGVLTGILKVAKESIFSGLNHLRTCSILGDAMAAHFGFSEAETGELVSCAGGSVDLESVRRWYNGYSFGGRVQHTLYNPWSIVNYLDEPGIGPRSFWKNTSNNALVRDLLIRHVASTGAQVEQLLRGEAISVTIDENTALQDLEEDPDAVFSLLTFSGYLTPESVAPTDRAFDVDLRIPNHEVRAVFSGTFSDWLRKAGQKVSPRPLEGLTRSILEGDVENLERELGAVLKGAMSYMDFGHHPVEAVYQAFIVGLLAQMQDTHLVRSNRESGYGRADVLILPRSPGTGVVLELKTVDATYDETPESALDAAARQLVERDYAAEVRAHGATEVHQYAVAFDGKRCWVRVV